MLPKGSKHQPFLLAETLPRGSRRDGKGDVYIMRQICHDWPDNATVEILTNLRTAMGDAPCTLALVEVSAHQCHGSHLFCTQASYQPEQPLWL